MIPTVVRRVPLPISRFEDHSGALDVAVTYELAGPRLHAPLVLDEAVVLETEHRPQLDAQELHYVPQNLQRRADLRLDVRVDFSWEQRARDHPLFVVDGLLPRVCGRQQQERGA